MNEYITEQEEYHTLAPDIDLLALNQYRLLTEENKKKVNDFIANLKETQYIPSL